MHGESRGGGTTVETNFIGYVYHCFTQFAAYINFYHFLFLTQLVLGMK